jgi:hypothetical protein
MGLCGHTKATVTGCLQKGDEAGEYSITGEDGKTYGLRSKTVKLWQHVGHKVTVTGTPRAESAEKEKGEAEEHEKKEATEAGHIRGFRRFFWGSGCKKLSDSLLCRRRRSMGR